MALAPPVPSLSLSDIMHPMSPPRERPPNSPVVESLQDQEVAQMRTRALQMGLNTQDATQSTPRERELYDMVLRLTNPNLPSLDPSQLVRQADTIADLVHQREYLTRRLEEERSRWQSEKDGWDRMSEALLVRQSRKANGPDESELKRMCQKLEYDNNAMKEKLNLTQGRINALEAELSKLKPHLLMQPFVPRPVSIPRAPITAAAVPPPLEPETAIASENAQLPPSAELQPASSSSKEAAISAAPQPSGSSEESLPHTLQPPSLHALAQASSYFTSLPFPSLQNVNNTISRKKKLTAQLKKALHPSTTASSATQSDASVPVFPAPPDSARTVLSTSGSSPKKLVRPTKPRRAPPQLFASDARAEHLLIAARRLGRERAGIVAGVISAERERMEREKAEREKERIEREKERIEREKRNRGGGGYYRERPGPETASRPAVSESPKRDENREGSNSSQYANAMAGYVNAAGAPTKSDANGKSKSAETPTPLDSLLDAARSMQQDDNDVEAPSASTSSVGTGMMTRRRSANVNESVSAPAPKRRRLSSDASDSPARVRTALDVLADQAAVFSNSDAPGKGKGKGRPKTKGLADELADNAVPLVKRKRGRPPNKDRNKPPPAAAASTVSRLISPAPVAGPNHAVTGDAGNSNASESGHPVTKWAQRGRLANSASSKAPAPQRDDVESEDEDEPTDTRVIEPAPAPPAAPAPSAAPAPPAAPASAPAPAPAPEPSPAQAPEPQVEMQDMEPVIRPTAVVAPRPADEVIPASQDPIVAETESVRSPPATLLDDAILDVDPVLDADADGDSDPDVDMDGTNPSLL
ncbi:hypothetical protein B0H19DRAFT_1099574 [Mycena capillaripes]|nr:hypothetical protein B0H19DRAFT_1099574 [Mycena capillaripes]